jgi:FixJ family two-component response regulator
MSNRRNIMDIRQLLVQIRAGSSNRQIAQDMRIDRQTVDRYREPDRTRLVKLQSRSQSSP